jgi:tRNA G18 (ribose-2'-O)-methylase SpoU
MIITSRANKTFKKLFALRATRGIEKYGEFLVGGEKIIEELLLEKKVKVSSSIRNPDMELPEKIKTLPYNPEDIVLSADLFNEINVFGTSSPLVSVPSWEFADFCAASSAISKGCYVFIPLADPENVGAIIRVAAGVGAKAVVLFKEAASPFLPKAVRSSAGALWKIPLFRACSIKDFFPPQNLKLYVLDMSGKSITDVEHEVGKPFGILCGMEGQGVPQHLLGSCEVIKIPMKSGIESLNAAVSMAIALWEFRPFL